jgi:hypothetical protein
MKRTVYILYGFGEGPGHSKDLRATLWAKGFIVTEKPEWADILIVHSGGMALLPKDTADKLIIVMNPSCCPRRKLLAVFIHKMYIECVLSFKNKYFLRWLCKAALNVWYTLARAPYNVRLVVKALTAPILLPVPNATKVWVVTARYDPWIVPVSDAERLSHYTYLSHGGSHDTIWLQPNMCADIVQSAYGA